MRKFFSVLSFLLLLVSCEGLFGPDEYIYEIELDYTSETGVSYYLLDVEVFIDGTIDSGKSEYNVYTDGGIYSWILNSSVEYGNFTLEITMRAYDENGIRITNTYGTYIKDEFWVFENMRAGHQYIIAF